MRERLIDDVGAMLVHRALPVLLRPGFGLLGLHVDPVDVVAAVAGGRHRRQGRREGAVDGGAGTAGGRRRLGGGAGVRRLPGRHRGGASVAGAARLPARLPPRLRRPLARRPPRLPPLPRPP